MLSVIIPTYNEAPNVRPLLERLAAVRERLGEPMEVLIVDDESPDGTAAAAEAQLAGTGLGRVITRRGLRDLSAAVADGVRQARGDLVAVMDADLSHPPELLPALVQTARKGSDVAIASRYVPGGAAQGWPLRRRWCSRAANALAWPLVRVHDATSGYFVCAPEALRRLNGRAVGFKVLLELLTAHPALRVREVPYVFTDRRAGTSKLGLAAMRRYARQLARLYRRRVRP